MQASRWLCDEKRLIQTVRWVSAILHAAYTFSVTYARPRASHHVVLLLQVCAATTWVRCSRNVALRFAGCDEGEERELWIALLQLSSVRSLQAVSVLAQEQEMLAMMLRRQDTDVDSAQREAEGAHCRGSVTSQGDV